MNPSLSLDSLPSLTWDVLQYVQCTEV
jgi:hypothetical protein